MYVLNVYFKVYAKHVSNFIHPRIHVVILYLWAHAHHLSTSNILRAINITIKSLLFIEHRAYRDHLIIMPGKYYVYQMLPINNILILSLVYACINRPVLPVKLKEYYLPLLLNYFGRIKIDVMLLANKMVFESRCSINLLLFIDVTNKYC